jgi:hypothetical protein
MDQTYLKTVIVRNLSRDLWKARFGLVGVPLLDGPEFCFDHKDQKDNRKNHWTPVGQGFRRRVLGCCRIRGAQTAVFELDIRIFNPPYIDVCQSLASETGLKSRNVEKRISAV